MSALAMAVLPAEPGSELRYYEVTDANHFDALVGLFAVIVAILNTVVGTALGAIMAMASWTGKSP